MLNHKRNLLYMVAIAAGLSILGFILDLHERVPNVWVNISEIFIMTLLLFVILILGYFLFVGCYRFFSISK